MAQAAVGAIPRLDFINATYINPSTGSSGTFLTAGGNYVSIFALRSRLQTVNAAYYTNARLDSLTVNDMIFALRNIDDPKSIADYMTASSA